MIELLKMSKNVDMRIVIVIILSLCLYTVYELVLKGQTMFFSYKWWCDDNLKEINMQDKIIGNTTFISNKSLQIFSTLSSQQLISLISS